MGRSRPTRTRHSVYQSLNENKLSNKLDELTRSPKKIRNRKHTPETDSYQHPYTLRGSRTTDYIDEGANYSDEEDETLTPLRQKSVKRRRLQSDDMDDDVVEEKIKKGKSKRIQDDDEDGDSKFTPRRSTRFAKNNEDFDQSEPQLNETNEKENELGESVTASRKRGRPRVVTVDSKHENDNDEEDDGNETDEKSRESTAEPRQYQLREKRPPVDRYVDSRPIRKAAPIMFSRQRFANNSSSTNRRNLREKRKRRYSSSSTSSSDEELTNAKRDAKDEAKFQRRLMRSMNQNRQNLLPINMTEKDLKGSKHLIKERLQQVGQVGGGLSCTDIDPMGIDKAVGFDQVGGLTSHLQSLKETVLFPLVYPELFEKFKITPPKGVLFYGPPGTGKTLIARALANECSQGDKKVAFFMRKGADVLSKWLGEAERNLRLLFDQAYSMRPSIIFFDEIDGLAPVRSSRQDQIHSSIVSTLLALMDGLDARGEVVVIGATNRLDSIDPALRRPGRFDRELRFSLPDKTARRAILDIHTKAWNEENRPSETEMDMLADNTGGYCGADLRSLCTEAVLVAIRNKFPHIYLTSDKLAVNPNLIKINQEHFVTAMRNIVPACRRDVSIVSKQLNPRLGCLMDSTIKEIFENRIPLGYLKPQNLDNLYSTALEMVVRALEIPPSVPASRFLLHGNGNQGQTHYYLPVIANHLDHLVMHSISCTTLFSSVNPEESLNQMIHAAIRSTSNGTPTVLLLPDFDVTRSSLPQGCWNMLISRLESFIGFTALIQIATLRCNLDECPDDIKQLFGISNLFEILPPSENQREAYFENIVSKALVEPVKFNADDYPIIPKAVETEKIRKLSAAELKIVEEKYENALRHFRIFLRDLLSKLIRDRRFNIFNSPVEIEDAEDYYDIIKNPLCLTEMMAKLNRNEYKNKQEFVDDIMLIRANAIEYNPETDMKSRLIRNNAYALLDITEALFEEELDDDFVEKLEEMKKMIDEAKSAKEKSSSHVFQLHRRTRQSIQNGFKENDEPMEIEKEVENVVETAKEEPKNLPSENVASSPKVQEEESGENKNTDPNNEASNDTPSVKSDTLPELNSDTQKTMEFVSQESEVVTEKSVDPVFAIDKDEIQKVISTAIHRTNNWSIPQLETLGAALTQRIERYTSKFDRTTLPFELIQLINEFVP